MMLDTGQITQAPAGTLPQLPPGVTVETPAQKELYQTTLEFERFFVKQMFSAMNKATEALSQDESLPGTGANGMYEQMSNDQMVEAVVGGGGLGIAAVIYGQLKDALPDAADVQAGAPAVKPGEDDE